jgi:probable phosphomutase (TIGR03848 family)
MPTFILIRHGENDYVKKHKLAGRLPGVNLNAKGHQQAQAIAEKLAGTPIKAIYSSPLERAMQTAGPLAQVLGKPVITRPGLLETDCGEWTGQSTKQLSRLKAWHAVQTSPSLFHFPNGESFAESQHRICQELEQLSHLHDPADLVACVSHADPIRLAVAFYLGLALDQFQRLSISTGSLTVLHIGDSTTRLLALNYDPFFTLTLPPPIK